MLSTVGSRGVGIGAGEIKRTDVSNKNGRRGSRWASMECWRERTRELERAGKAQKWLEYRMEMGPITSGVGIPLRGGW